MVGVEFEAHFIFDRLKLELQSMERVQFKIQAFQISALVCVSTLNGHMSHGVSDRDKKC